MMSRIYQNKEEIDSDQIREFFNERARKEANAVNAVMLQSSGSTIAVNRDAHEREYLLPRLSKPSKILDFGCGAGRLSKVYAGESHSYLGLDFSEDLISLASKESSTGDVYFQLADIPNIDPSTLKLKPPFDYFIVTGLFIYLNDQAVFDTLSLIAQLSSKDALVYIRESVSEMDVRLTLKEYFSEELDQVYNAIYRTPDELRDVIGSTLVPAGFQFQADGDYAFPPHLRNRAETAQRYFILSRGTVFYR